MSILHCACASCTKNIHIKICDKISNLYEVETDVLVERVESQFCQPMIAPRAMHKEQLVQESELTPTTHTHTRLTALCRGLPRLAGTRKVKPIWILLKQETVSGSGISLAICKSAPRSRQITMPPPHHSVFYRPSCHPTNSVKALKALTPTAECTY